MPSGRRAFQAKGYVPGLSCCWVLTRRPPSGPFSCSVTVDGRTTLNVNASLSLTPSLFGDTTGADGGETTTPAYSTRSASAIPGTPPGGGVLRSLPSKAMPDAGPPASAVPVTAPSAASVWPSSKFVMPEPGRPPSTEIITMLPSAR